MSKGLTGRHVLIILLAFFGVTIGVNVYFITVALQTASGEDQKKSYLQGLHYNDMLARRARQVDLGWTAEVSTVTRGPDRYEVMMRIASRDGEPVDGLKLTAALRRPVQAAMDRALAFEQRSSGAYVATIQDLARGQWRLKVTAEDPRDPQRTMDAESKLWVP